MGGVRSSKRQLQPCGSCLPKVCRRGFRQVCSLMSFSFSSWASRYRPFIILSRRRRLANGRRSFQVVLLLRWVGSLVLIAWQLADKTSKRKFYVAAASGLVLGHGIFSIIEALLSLGGITAGNVGSCAGCAGVEYFSCGGGCPSS